MRTVILNYQMQLDDFKAIANSRLDFATFTVNLQPTQFKMVVVKSVGLLPIVAMVHSAHGRIKQAA